MRAFRRLDGVKRRCDGTGEGPGHDFNAAVREMNRQRQQEKDAMIALVEFARALAGTVMPEAEAAEREPRPAEQPSPAPGKPRQRPRPDQHTEVTHEEAWACEWVNENQIDPNPKPAPPPPLGFGAWDLIIPSYYRDPEEEE